jgi:type IV secretion system protein VirD4
MPLVLLACLTYAAWIGTQWMAYRLGYPRALGAWAYRAPPDVVRWWRAGAALLAGVAVVAALLARRSRSAPAVCAASLLGAATMLVVSLGPVYAPQSGLAWLVRYRDVPQLAGVLQEGVWAFGGAFIGAMMLVLAARPRRTPRTPSTSHGSAGWGRGQELMTPTGLMLGRALSPSPDASRAGPPLLRYRGDGHILTVAPTRSGKGVGCVVPNLLTYPGSVLVTDPKGENVAVTARARRSLGQFVHAIDPFDAVGGTAAFNPLDLVDPRSADAVDDARLLADMLVVPDAKNGGEQVFRNEEARGLLSGLILHVAASAPTELRTLAYVRELLTHRPERFSHLLKEMLESDAVGGLVSRAAARLLQ